jgi:hypothetical protein
MREEANNALCAICCFRHNETSLLFDSLSSIAREHHLPGKRKGAHERTLIVFHAVSTSRPMHGCLDKLPSPCAFPVIDKIVFRQRSIARVVETGLVLEAVKRLVQLTHSVNSSAHIPEDRGEF